MVLNPLTANLAKMSNKLKQFVGCCLQIVWVCLIILFCGVGAEMVKEKLGGNKLKWRRSVNIVNERSRSVGKAKCTKNKKYCFEWFISENTLKTIVTFTSKTMEKTRTKSELALDYRTMDANIDEIRCLNAVLLFRGV